MKTQTRFLLIYIFKNYVHATGLRGHGETVKLRGNVFSFTLHFCVFVFHISNNEYKRIFNQKRRKSYYYNIWQPVSNLNCRAISYLLNNWSAISIIFVNLYWYIKWTSTLDIAFFNFILYIYQSIKAIQMSHCTDINHHTQILESILFLLENRVFIAGRGGSRKTGIVVSKCG